MKGHLDQQRQRKRKQPISDEQPTSATGTRSHTIYSAIIDLSAPTGHTYSDLTGRFPVQSNHGADYILVVYEYNSNAILVRPLRSRTAPEIKSVFQNVVHYLTVRGLRPRLHTLDNEASTILRDYLRSEDVEYTRVIIHEKPTNRQTWAPHGTDGWYVGPALHHYQCYRVWVPHTHAKRIVDTISFFPKTVPMPDHTHKDAVIQAARELTHALQQPHFRGPLAQFHDNYLTSLLELSKIFHTIAPGVEPIAPGVDNTKATPLPAIPPPKPATLPNKPTTPTPTQHIRNVPYNLCPRTSCPHYAASITHSETGQSMEYKDLITDPSTRATWLHSAANEFRRLAQGFPDKWVEPTNTMFFIPFSQVPKHK